MEKQKVSLRKNDRVQVIAGKEKGRVSTVISIDRKGLRVLIKDVNIAHHYKKKTQSAPGEVLLKENAVHLSNVLLYCESCGKGVRHSKVRETSSDHKVLVTRRCKKCSSPLEPSTPVTG